jgi:ATP adenylyltransferase
VGIFGMQTLWAPWRIEYILGEKEQGCIFCKAFLQENALTLFKSKTSMVLMNKFPYINGHLLVAPVRHASGLDQLDREELSDLMTLVRESTIILKQAINPDGFNVGLNLGKVAGAGVEEHLHCHIVPRWFGDSNFMAVLADVRVIPEHVQATHDKLKPYFDQLDLTRA